MVGVDAVKHPGEISLIQRKFEQNGWALTADLWRLGLNLALRISDLLLLKYADLELPYIDLIEKKTKKKRRIKINQTARAIIDKRRKQFPGHVYLFQATGNRIKNQEPKPISRQYVTLHFREVGAELGLKLGTHSMRKTRGWVMHKSGLSIESICKVLNHSNPAVTMRYIGLTQEDIDQTYDDFEL